MNIEQLELGQAYARATDPGTSHAAAEAMNGSDASRMEAKVLEALDQHAPYSGLTTHEIAELTGIEYGTVTPRIRPLVRKGLVVDSGERRIPRGRTKKGIVWRAT